MEIENFREENWLECIFAKYYMFLAVGICELFEDQRVVYYQNDIHA